MYQFFGSENSLDIDIMFWVEEIPENVQEARALTQALAHEFQQKKQLTKKINANIGKVQDGKIVALFKGIVAESNNALIHTYSLHYQDYPNQITQLLPQNIAEKTLRTARVLLSFLTKTTQRSAVKMALRGNFVQKLAVLGDIQLSHFETESALGNTNTIVDFQKTFAFQLGQTLALWEGKELFTKNEIGLYFPNLQPYLDRTQGISNALLQKYLELFVAKGLENLTMIAQFEA
jgi:hypothetical protein